MNHSRERPAEPSRRRRAQTGTIRLLRCGQLIPLDDGRFAEAEPPKELPGDAVTVLEVQGSLFFAGARTLSERLPSPRGTKRPAVVLRLRGRTQVGATLIDVLDEYADDLAEVGGRLYLSGVHAPLAKQLRNAGKLDVDRSVQLTAALPIHGASTAEALAKAKEWVRGGQ